MLSLSTLTYLNDKGIKGGKSFKRLWTPPYMPLSRVIDVIVLNIIIIY